MLGTRIGEFSYIKLSDIKVQEINNQKIDSREELQHLVDESQDVLTDEEKKLITHFIGMVSVKMDLLMD